MKKLLALVISLISLSPLFFHKLGQSSLVSFDEAWYAEISKQLLFTGTPFSLRFNSNPFVDHPPAGFWLIASTQALFGINEFGSRVAGAIAGLLVLAVIFVFGALMFHPVVGFSSAIALASSPWFIYRARSGNLDIFLSLFYSLTLLLAWKAAKNTKYIGAFFVSLTVLLLTKTASPWTIIPALIFMFWKSPVVKSKKFLISLSLSLVTIMSYFLLQFINVPDYLGRLLFVGAPKVGQSFFIANLILVKTYLHLGLGVWFKPAVLFLPIFILLFRKKKSLNPCLPAGMVLIALISFLLPFTLSPKTQIWHLIPTYPLLILIAISTFYHLVTKLSLKLAVFLTLTLTFTYSLPQITKNWREIIDIPAYVSDEAILSRASANYPYPLVIDENFIPTAVFYSNKPVSWNNSRKLSDFAPSHQPTLIITHDWRLKNPLDSFDDYRILATDRDKVLLLYNSALR